MNDIFDTLRDHDAAPARPLTAQERDRSSALLRSVLADAPTIPVRARRSRRPLIAFGAVAAGAFLLAGALVVAPHLAGRFAPAADQASGPLTTAQLASWTSTPTALSGALGATQKQWCLDSTAGGPASGDQATVTNADQRGDVASMIINRGGYAMLCIVGDKNYGFWEVDGGPNDPATTVAADAITVGSAGSHGDGASGLTYVEGLVGTDVKSITINDSGKTFQATVENGRWTAWWPTTNPHGGLTGTVTITTKDGVSHTEDGNKY